VACVVLGTGYGVRTAPERVECEAEWVSLSVGTLLDGRVAGSVWCTNKTRLRVSFESMNADLFIDGQEVEYTLEGLSRGDVFEPGRSRRAKVVVFPSTETLVLLGSRLVRGKTLRAEMKGVVTVKLFGFVFDVPLEESVDVKL
jgi:hypothetical protein